MPPQGLSVPFRVRQQVRFAETDLQGVVYYANYLVYAEVGRFRYLRELGLTYDTLLARGLDFTIGEARVKYHAPLRFADEFDVLIWVSEVRRVSWELTYAVDRADGTRCADLSTVQVLLDREAGRPARLPSDVRDRLVEAMATAGGGVAGARVPSAGGR